MMGMILSRKSYLGCPWIPMVALTCITFLVNQTLIYVPSLVLSTPDGVGLCYCKEHPILRAAMAPPYMFLLGYFLSSSGGYSYFPAYCIRL